MIKLKIILFKFLFFFVALSIAQQSKISIDSSTPLYPNWDSYYSYNSISGISGSASKPFFSTYNSFFSLDNLTFVIDKYDTLNGLVGDEISAFYHSEINNIIVIGYNNGFLQIIDLNNNDVFNFFDILNKPTISSDNKTINHFFQNGEDLLISTAYGISVFNLGSFEFGDTYYIGDFAELINVTSTTIHENYIYASCNDFGGLKRANMNSTLIDYNNWEQVIEGNYYDLFTLNDKLFFRSSNNIFSYQNSILENSLNFEDDILDFNFSGSSFVITSTDKCILFDNNFNTIMNIDSSDFQTNFTNGRIFENNLYIGSESKGVFNIDLNYSSFQNILPNGPLFNNIFSVETSPNMLYLVYGAYSQYFNPHPLTFKGLSFFDETQSFWTNISKDSIPQKAVNLNNIAINPFNNNNIFISSFHGGLLELENNKVINFYDETNSSLESLFIPNSEYSSIRISDIEFDTNGTLWLLNSMVDSPLKSYNLENNSWNSYDFTEIINDGFQDELGFNDIEVDDYGNKWIAGLRSGLIGFNNESGTNQLRKVFSQDQSNMPSSYVKSIAVDNNNHLWIGTIQGLRVLYNTSNFFDTSVVTTQQIVILEDGIPRELLEQQYISDIEVDGANNKWVATIGSGVFYFSPNGQQTIHHFTKENSPLPSNNINDISINYSNGKVYFATDNGLVSYNTGSTSSSENFSNTYVYPNPVRPEFNTEFEKVKITGLTQNVNIKITDIEGNLVAEAQSNINSRYRNFNLEIDGGTAFWNGKNLRNRLVSSGVYIIMLSDLDSYETKVLKLMIVR